MYKKIVQALLLLAPLFVFSQNRMTPDLLWKLGRVTGTGISKDGKYIVYSVNTPDWETNKGSKKSFIIPVNGGTPVEISKPDSLLADKNISPDGKFLLSNKEVKIKKISGTDYYPELTKSNAYIFDNLNNRHWDTWEDGSFDHVFVSPVGKTEEGKDIMPGEPYDSPQKPFGGDEDYIWTPDGKAVVYVTKKKYGKDYAISTNTDLYQYDLNSGTTKNLTEGMMGYDINPSYSKNGTLAWLSMKRDGYESDKQDLVAFTGVGKDVVNLTGHRDEIHVEGFRWSDDGKKIFFWAPINGTEQLFEVDYVGATKKTPSVKQLTKGDFDIAGIVGQTGNKLIVARTDMNHAAELFSVDLSDGRMAQLTHVNDDVFNSIGMCKTERKWAGLNLH